MFNSVFLRPRIEFETFFADGHLVRSVHLDSVFHLHRFYRVQWISVYQLGTASFAQGSYLTDAIYKIFVYFF